MSFASCCGITLLHAKSLTLNRNHHQQRVCKVRISIEPTYIHCGDSLCLIFSSRGLNEHVKILLTTLTTCTKRWEMDWMRWSVKSSSSDAFIDFYFVFVPFNLLTSNWKECWHLLCGESIAVNFHEIFFESLKVLYGKSSFILLIVLKRPRGN